MKNLILWFCVAFLITTSIYASAAIEERNTNMMVLEKALELDAQITTEHRNSRIMIEAAALDDIIDQGSYITQAEIDQMKITELYIYQPQLVNKKLLAMKTRDRREAIKNAIIEIASENGVSPTLVLAIAKAESHFNPMAVSPVGAKGVMQLMDGTADDHGVEDSHNTIENIKGGVIYLKKLLKRFDHNIVLAVAAYNAGPKHVERYGGVPPFKETQEYVKKVLTFFREYKEEGRKC